MTLEGAIFLIFLVAVVWAALRLAHRLWPFNSAGSGFDTHGDTDDLDDGDAR